MTHTPTPWKVWLERDMDAPGYRRIKLIDAEQFIIAELTVSKESQMDDAEKNADRIVKAVNAHDDLLAACEIAVRIIKDQMDMAEDFEHMMDSHDETTCELCQIEAVIKKAKGEA